jgi:hypothetical protein
VTLLILANSSHKEPDTLLSIALSQELEEPLKAVFLYTYVEKVSAEVIEASGERKLRRLLCKMSSKRRVGRALAILRREGVLSEDEYRELKRVFRAYHNCFGFNIGLCVLMLLFCYYYYMHPLSI